VPSNERAWSRDRDVTRDEVYETLCRMVGAGEVAFASDIAEALRDRGHREIGVNQVRELLESLVDAGLVTDVPADCDAGDPSRLAFGIPQNSR